MKESPLSHIYPNICFYPPVKTPNIDSLESPRHLHYHLVFVSKKMVLGKLFVHKFSAIK